MKSVQISREIVLALARTLALAAAAHVLGPFAVSAAAGPSARAESTPPAGSHPHEAQSCRTCHLREAGLAADLDALREAACVRCHRDARASLADSLGFHRAGAGRCLDCHGFHDSGVTRGRAAGIPIRTARTVATAHCRSCHDPRGDLQELSEGHVAAAEFYHRDTAVLAGQTPSEGCLNCHGDTPGADWSAAGGGAPAIREHASHPVGVAVLPGRGAGAAYIRSPLDPRIPLYGGKMECQSCHLLSASTQDRILPVGTRTDLCVGCHQTQGRQADDPSAMAAAMLPRR